MKVRSRSVLVAAVAALACLTSGCASEGSAKSQGTLKIGVINPFNGPNASGGEAIFEGYQLAVEGINKKGGVLGKKVQLIKGDASTPEQGVSEVNRLATSSKVDMFAGTYLSGVANTASETALRYGKLYWDTNASAGDLTERGLTNFVRSGVTASLFAKIAGESFVDLVVPNTGLELNGLRVCLTYEESIYGSSTADSMKKSITEAGAKSVKVVAYNPASPDLGNVILRCQKEKADIWANVGYVPDTNLLLRTAIQQDFKPAATMLVGTGDNVLTLDSLGAKSLEGIFVVAYPHVDMADSYAPGIKEFRDSYDAKFGGVPTYPQTLSAYTGMNILFDSLAKAGGVDPAKVQKAIAGFDKPIGSYANGFGAKFDKMSQNQLALPTVVQWQSGKTVTVFPEIAKLEGMSVAKSAK